MAVIITLNKQGKPIKTPVMESVVDIWDILNHRVDINSVVDMKDNRDFIMLTDKKGNNLLFQKRYIWKLEE